MRPVPIAHVVVGKRAAVGDGEHGLEEMRGHHRREIPFELYEHRELHFLDDLAAVHVAGTFAKLGEGRNVLLDLLVFDGNLQAAHRHQLEGGLRDVNLAQHAIHVLHRKVRGGGAEPEVSAHLEYPLDERGAVLHVRRGVGVEPPSLLGPLALPQGLEHLAPDVAGRRRGGVAVAESLAELGEGGSPEGRPQRRSSLRGELGGLRLVELALPRAEAGGIGQRLVVADEEIVVAERVRLEPVRRTRGLRTDIVPGPAVHRGRGARGGAGVKGVLVGPDRAKPEIDRAEHVGHGVVERRRAVRYRRRRRARRESRVYGAGSTLLVSSLERRAESVVFSRCRVAP
mmetsp:Transcript_5943/g.24542  ORF Transcript_5943/g.24542 Transcript_5943/m.24542 type:complete len:342 (-) Transcript_5943:341-1366(-)